MIRYINAQNECIYYRCISRFLSFIRKIKIFCKREEIDALVNPSLVNSFAIFNLAKLPKELLLHFGGISFRSTSIHSNKCRVLHNCVIRSFVFSSSRLRWRGEIRPTSCLSHGFIWEIYDLIAFSPLFRHIGPKDWSQQKSIVGSLSAVPIRRVLCYYYITNTYCICITYVCIWKESYYNYGPPIYVITAKTAEEGFKFNIWSL